MRYTLKQLLTLTGNGRISGFLDNLRPMSQEEQDVLVKRQRQLYQTMTDKWRDAGIQAIVMPNFPTASFKDENSGDLGALLDYLFAWSLLHYPCGVIPVTEVLTSEDGVYEDTFNDMATKKIKQDVVGSTGMPVGIQIIA